MNDKLAKVLRRKAYKKSDPIAEYKRLKKEWVRRTPYADIREARIAELNERAK